MPRSRLALRGAALLFVLVGICSSGCARSDPVLVDYAREFPPGARQSEVLDIHVLRREGKLFMTNTSGREFPACTMWLNGRFSKPIEAIGVGQTVEYTLTDFVDEYSERFRAGGFWATEAPEPVVLVQLELPGEGQTPDAPGPPRIIGFIVAGKQEE
jgi:hypothetical protein